MLPELDGDQMLSNDIAQTSDSGCMLSGSVALDEGGETGGASRVRVAAFREGPQLRVVPLPPGVLDDFSVLLSALRSQPPEGGPFVIECVEEQFFVIARQDGRRISLLLRPDRRGRVPARRAGDQPPRRGPAG